MVTCEVFVNQILMKIEMKINEISSKVLSKVKSQLPYPPLNLKRKLEDRERRRDLEEIFIMVCMGLSLDSLLHMIGLTTAHGTQHNYMLFLVFKGLKIGQKLQFLYLAYFIGHFICYYSKGFFL